MPLQLEIREYGGVSKELVELATSGINQVLEQVQTPQNKPLRVHITEGSFQTLMGVDFIEVYLPRPDYGDIHIAYQGGYLRHTRKQLAENYGIPVNSTPEYIWLYLACHSGVHYTQDLQGKLSSEPPSHPPTLQAYLQTPIEQEAHEVGLSAAQLVSIPSPTIYQVTTEDINALTYYPISFKKYLWTTTI